MFSVQNRFQTAHPVALVTGSGAPRVGNAIACHLATLGCHIALHANDSLAAAEQTADSLQRADTQCMIVQGPIDQSAAVEGFVQQVTERFGRLDILVNSAAIWSPKSLEDVTADDVRRYLEVNTLGSFVAARAAGLQMVSQPTGGCIINIGDWALVRPYLDHAAYFPSKGAIESMTRSLAVEFAQRNRSVFVNCIHPGPVLLADDLPEEKRRAVAASTLVKRVGTAEHIAHAVQMLVENDFITGTALVVDGGRTIYSDDGLQTGYRTG